MTDPKWAQGPDIGADIEGLYKQLREAHRQQYKTLEQLLRSLILKTVYPDVFKHGACKVKVRGNVIVDFHQCLLIITDGSGTEHQFQLKDVPIGAWPAYAQDDFKMSSNYRNWMMKKKRQKKECQ